MKLLLVSATEAEISPLLAHMQKLWQSPSTSVFVNGSTEIHICITGVGIMAAAYHLAKTLSINQYDLALQAGVAGSFSPDIALGELVFVNSDQYGDLGAEDHYNFLDIFDLGLLGENEAPFSDKKITTAYTHPLITFKKVNGLTVNRVAGSEFTIIARKEKFNCDIESMEGLSFHYACAKENIPYAQIRSISNYVTPRDKESWKMKEAIINLNEWLINFIEKI
jgi:futalosine hydrolase